MKNEREDAFVFGIPSSENVREGDIVISTWHYPQVSYYTETVVEAASDKIILKNKQGHPSQVSYEEAFIYKQTGELLLGRKHPLAKTLLEALAGGKT